MDIQWSQEKIKTMLMQSFGGQTKSIIVFLKVAYRQKNISLYDSKFFIPTVEQRNCHPN